LKKLLLGFGIFSLIFFLAPPVTAESESQEATAEITTELIKVEITPTSWDYGVVRTGGNWSSESPTVEIRNTGNIEETFDMMGGNASGGETESGSWTIAENPGVDEFVHQVAFDDLGGVGITTKLSNQYQNVNGIVNPGESAQVKLKMQTPTSSTVPGTYATKVWVRAMASDM